MAVSLLVLNPSMSPPVASSEGDGLIHSTGISIADVIKLPVCVDPLWSGPRQDMPYPMFKTLVQQQQAVYELKGGASFQYLMRCLDQPLLSEVQSAYLGGISQEKVWQCLDNRYEASWRTYGMNQRWKHLEQEPGETVHDFADRVKSLASIIHISTGSKPSEVDQAGAFRDGLAPSIYDKVDNFLGPRYVCFEEAKEVAEYYEFKVTKGNSKARNKIAPKNDKNKSHKVMETCRHFLRGVCSYGDKCRYSHSVPTPSQSKPSVTSNSEHKPAGICHQFSQYGTCNRDRCQFRHEQSSKKAPTGVSDAKGSAMVVIDEANESGEDELWPLVMVVQDGDSKPVPERPTRSLTAALQYRGLDDTSSKLVLSLLDTGCTINLISLSAATQLSLSIEQLPTSRNVTLANGSTMPLIGKTLCYVGTSKTSSLLLFWVVRELAFEAVLGLDALSKLHINIELSPDSIPKVSSGVRGVASQPSSSGAPVFSCGVIAGFTQGSDDTESDSQSYHTAASSDLSNHECDDEVAGEPTAPVQEFDDHFEVSIPWKTSSRPKLNKAEAHGRFQSLLRHTTSDDVNAIQNELNTMLQLGRIRECHPNNISYYLPLRPVYKPSSVSTQVRITVDGRRLNDYTHKCSTAGKLRITDVLIVMRSSVHYTTLDLQRAFNCIKLSESSQCWFGIYAFGGHYIWLCLPFGCNFSSASLQESLTLRSPPLQLKVSLPFTLFVDDIGVRGATVSELHSNEKVVVEGFEEKGFIFQALKRVSTDGSSSGSTSYLGYIWDVDKDFIIQQLPQLSLTKPVTKRSLISALAVWYDIAGFFIGVGVSARQLASQIHEELPHWETPATEELKGKVEQWYDAVRSASFSTPRALNLSILYTFSDSSVGAWCAQTTCPIISTTNGPLHPLRSIAGIYAPTCRWSIPKKELYALWRATRLAMEILGNCRSFKIPVSAVYFYTDSAICLWRLKRPKLDEDLSGLEKRWIREIRVVCEKLRTANLQGKVAHVRSASNLADAPTRSSFQPTTSVTAETARQWSNGSALVVYDPGQKAASHSADVGLSAEDFGLQCMAVVSNAGSETSIGPTTTSPPTEWRQRARVHQDTSPYLSTLKYFIVNGKSPPNCSVPHRLLVDATKYHVVEDNLICRAIRTTSDGQVLHQVVLDPKVDKDNLIYDVIDHYHSRTTHLGADAISREIKAEYYWPSMNRYVRSRLKSCDPCQRVHASVAWRKTVGVLRMKSTVPGQILGVDHVTNLPTGEGNYRHVLTVVCAATGYTWFRASRTVKTAETTKILESLLADISWPLCFVVDGGFKSEHFKEWCSVRNIRVAVLPPHHKSYGGWLERCHLHLRQYFATKHASGEDIKSWPTWIDDLQLVHNLTYFPGLSFGPGDLFFGRQLLRPWRTTSSEGQEVKDALRGVGQLLCPEEDVFLEELYKHRREEYGLRLQQYQRFWEDIKEVQQVKLSRRVRHGPFVFPVGAKCLVYCPEASNFKHSLKFAGPYEIEEWVSGSLRKIKSLGQGGHGLRDISPLQSVYNLCPYYEREDEEIQCWVQCDICDRWIPVTTSMYGRFSAMSTRFSCRLAGLHCRVAVSP